MANLELEAFQKKGFEKKGAEYSFTCKDAEANCKESPKITTEKVGVRLHFLRRGLFDKANPVENEIEVEAPKAVMQGEQDATTFTGMNYLEEIMLKATEFSRHGLPNLKNFEIARTSLHKGYIYIINDTNKNEFYELEVAADGTFAHVLWEFNKDENGEYLDIRTKEKERLTYKIVEKGKQFRIAFSPVPWSRKQFNDINASDTKKAELMELVDCSGFPVDKEIKETEFALPFSKIEAGFLADDSYAVTLEENLNNIFIAEREQAEDKEDDKVLEDMFITFNDPVSFANDITAALSDQKFKFRALVEAIQTGCKINDAYDRISSLDTSKQKEPDKDYTNMYNLALASYKMVYSSKEFTKDHDGGSEIGGDMFDTHFPYQPSRQSYYNNQSSIDKINKIRTQIKTSRRRKPKGFNYQYNEHIGHGLHREKVEGVLGVHERRAKRETILSYREDLGNYLKSDFVQNSLAFNVLENIDEFKLYGQAGFLPHMNALAENPYDIDRDMLLPESNTLEVDRYHTTDKWINWVIPCKQADKPITNDGNLKLLITEKLTIQQQFLENKKNVDLINKFGDLLVGFTTFYGSNDAHFNAKKIQSGTGGTRYLKELDGKFRRITKRLNKITVKGTIDGKVMDIVHFVPEQGGGISMNAAILGADYDPNLQITVKGAYGKILAEFEAEGFTYQHLSGEAAKASGGRARFDIQSKVEDISKAEYTANKIAGNNARRFNEKAYKILTSRGFTGALTAMQVLNFSYAAASVFESIRKQESKWDIGKNLVSAGGIAAELVNAQYALREAFTNVALKKLGQEATKQFTRKMLISGTIGGVVTAGMCFWDAAIAFNKSDTDAGVALAIAGAAFTVSTAAGLWGASVFILSGPVGWIALGVGLIAVGLVYLFTDTDLQTYFKNFIYSDQFNVSKGSLTPMRYNRLLFTKIDKLVPEYFHDQYMHPEDAIASLHDLTVCTKIQYYSANTRTVVIADTDIYSTYQMVSSMGFLLTFNKFLNNLDQIEAFGLTLAEYKKHEKPISLNFKTKELLTLKTGQKQLHATVDIPKDYENVANFVVAIRVNTDKEKKHYFPHDLVKTKNRYIGAKFNLMKTAWHKTGKENSDVQEVVYDTLANLKLRKTW